MNGNTPKAQTRPFDVVIAGSGLTGSILAVALTGKVRPQLRVALCGRAGADRNDPRAYAIAPGVRLMLEVLGIWERVETRAAPVMEMRITDSRLEDVVRPLMLSLGEGTDSDAPLAHIVPAGALAEAADSILAESAVERVDPGTFRGFETDGGRALLVGSNATVEGTLVVAADGARSVLREMAGIRTVGWDYGQSGVVATLQAEIPHGNRAVQHFLPDGPFALLPLPDNLYSLVCSMPKDRADALAALAADELKAELEARAGAEIGPLTPLTPAVAFPLGLHLARSFIAPRLALAGDAAHRMHPLAGQGQNMGLRDVAALAQVIVEAARLGQDIGGLDVLERYQRWRRFDTVQFAMVTDGLNRLFSNDIGIVRALRDTGLGIFDRLSGLKRQAVRDAAGLSGDVPRLLLGLPA
ncbi:MAG: FAD-dependent monooxygenase [Rhodobiaceae bacterium]|nr:FAD-dependent monooxygenase [Rhodobiaceae bacterium]MCC0055468.1 FAD-dependent monooxygenase [Rhodobiaceae bacterium]